MTLPMSDPGQAALSGSDAGRGGDDLGGDDGRGARDTPRGLGKFLYASNARPLDGYTIKRGIGRGGFGEVYFATSDAGKEVALKLIRRNLDVELRGVRHCLNLKHHNLIDLYDIRTDDLDDQWVVMEYVSGQSLEDAIEANPTGMPLEDVEWWIRGIAAGVGYLHDHGIVHRDLKPGNIFLDTASASLGEPGVVKIGDYGLSKFISCSRRSGQTESVGTVHYMAPEIANGRYGREIDTYALGIILYEMLTGHVPFEGESVGEVLMKHLTAEPNLDQLSPAYREIVARALAKDPAVRLSGVHELVAMLPGAQPAGARAKPDHSAGAQNRQAGDRPTPGPERYAGYDDDPWPSAHRDAVIEEPMYAALRRLLLQARSGWRDADVPLPVRAIIIVLLILAVSSTVGLWGPMGVMLAVFYSIYYVVWTVLLKPGVRAHTASAQPPRPRPKPDPLPVAQLAVHRPRPKPWREAVHERLRAMPARERLSRLLGSMLLSAILCVLASAATATWLTANRGGDWAALNLWLTIVTTAGCWAVLVTNALTEARSEDQAPMRAILLGAGAMVGLLAFGVGGALSLDLPLVRDFGPPPTGNLLDGAFQGHRELRADWQRNVSAPGAAVSMAYFALLFAIPRWWRLAEYTRAKRVGLWSVASLMLAAWLLHLVWWYPQPVGLLVAGVVAFATQLSSPWLVPSKRVELARGGATV